MNLVAAQRNATKILDAERRAPTLRYLPAGGGIAALLPAMMTLVQPNQHPRLISESPGCLRLSSRNYEALKSFLDEIPRENRDAFLTFISRRFIDKNAFEVDGKDVLGAGQTSRTFSELPLVAEFLVRQNHGAKMIQSLAQTPLRPGLTRLLLHLEEMIALDYILFSDQDYDNLEEAIAEKAAAIDALSRGPRIADTLESNFRFNICKEGPILCDSILQQCSKAKYLRLLHKTTTKEMDRIEGLDALSSDETDNNFDLLAKEVWSYIESGEPELGLDRLHTYVVRFIRNLYRSHFKKEASREATANNLLGEVANDLKKSGKIKSRMAVEILKSSARVLEEFNHVRNNQSLAHDNSELVGRDEAYFIYQGIAASIRFLKMLDPSKEENDA